ncbi:MAG: DUF4442 domain-containing protein [Spirochaetes bacterium]|nr:DUF4442 domain-containing protein [Spirochaetota bacterium]
MSVALKMFNRLSPIPLGKRVFSRILCLKAPYFRGIRPLFCELRPGHCEVSMKNRRGIHNHLGTVHAIAMANLCELTGGTCMEVSVPGDLRWIAKSMNIEYLRISREDLRATCDIEVERWEEKRDYPVTVHVKNGSGDEVSRAVISMYVSGRKRR